MEESIPLLVLVLSFNSHSFAEMSEVYSGNFASGQTDEVIRATLKAAGPRALVTGAPGSPEAPVYRYPKTPQCPPVFISPYSGGATSSIFLKNRMNSIAICTAEQNLAVAKLRQIPGCPVNLATRFVQEAATPWLQAQIMGFHLIPINGLTEAH
jgi:hypothetical protein